MAVSRCNKLLLSTPLMHSSASGLIRRTSAYIASSRSATLGLLAFLLVLIAVWQLTSVAPVCEHLKHVCRSVLATLSPVGVAEYACGRN